MAVQEALIGMSLEEFMRLFDEEGPFELIDGERIAYIPTKMFGNFRLANRLALTFNVFAVPKSIGEAFVEGTFVMPDAARSNWIKGSRIPDVMFIGFERIQEYRQNHADWETMPLALVPDFAIEIISETDNYSDVIKKVGDYLRDGVKLVWVIEPLTRQVTVHLPNSRQQTTYSFDDKILIGDVIPGLEICVTEILK